MEYRTLTGTGITVSRLTLGTMTYGREVDEATAIRMTRMALDAGINVVDTADVYNKGQSEVITGKALQGVRDSIVLATKVCRPSGPYPLRDTGLHRWHIIKGVEDSLRRLQTDRVDLLYMHRPDRNTPIEESLAAFDHLIQQGKVMYVAMSNFASWQVCEALWKAQVSGWGAPAVVQLPYNLITRSIDEECTEFCTTMGIGITVYNPLAGGFLTGKHRRDQAPSQDTRLGANEDYYRRFWHPANFDALETLEQIAARAGKSLIELSLQWLASQPHVDSIILGASKPEHLEANIRSADGRLDDDTLAACDQVWATLRGPHFKYNR